MKKSTMKHDYQTTSIGNIATRGPSYIDELRREYSLYVLQNRALVSEADGLKSSGRRLLFTARDGSTIKTNTLAANTTPLHPHGAPDDVACTIAAPFINNIPLLEGVGNFGSYLMPRDYGATRYTSVRLSKFTKDVVFVDSDIIPMRPNYDMTREEPVHLLPLLPIGLINASEGIAVGFSSNILPRNIQDVIRHQIAILENKRSRSKILPYFGPYDMYASEQDGQGRWVFSGVVEVVAHNMLRVTKIPYGSSIEHLTKQLTKLQESGDIVSFVDESSATVNVLVTVKRGMASKIDALVLFGLTSKHTERIVMVDTAGTRVVERTPEEAIREFTMWRLKWFIPRYEHLRAKHRDDLQYVNDYLLTVDSGAVSSLTKRGSKDELEAFLGKQGVVFKERIARLPAYSFTKVEYNKFMAKKQELELELQLCERMLGSEDERKQQYVRELKTILANAIAGKYTTVV